MGSASDIFTLHAGVLWAGLGALAAAGIGALALWARFWPRYVEERETYYQPHVLIAIANEEGGRLGSPFEDRRRPGDWGILERALFKWSDGLTGFSKKGFQRVFALNGFGEYERSRLTSMLAKTRADAAWRLGQMVYFKAIPDLLPMLRDRSPEVRRMASWALAKMGQSDASGLAVTSPAPEIVREDSGLSTGTVSGRFFWENGAPVVIGNKEETDYLVHHSGGLDGDVRVLPSRSPGGRVDDGTDWRSYSDGYTLAEVRPGRPAVKAVLKQGIEDYYAVLHRQRDNIQVRPGSVTKNIDFVFPRFQGRDDRVSLQGALSYPGKLPAAFRGLRMKAVVSLRGAKGFYSGYLSYKDLKTYRIHDVPPGRYRLRAKVAAFVYEGEVEIGPTQPQTLDLVLDGVRTA